MNVGTDAARRRAAGAAIGAAIVILVAGVATFAYRKVVPGPSACASLPTTLVDTEGAATLPPDDVLLHVSVSNAMSGLGAPTLVLTRSGDVVALDEWKQTGEATYRRARLDAPSVEAWTGCLENADFRELSNDHTSQQGPTEGGGFCAVADASETVLAAGPASSSVKAVRVYNLDTAGGRAGGCTFERPRPIPDLGGSAELLRAAVAASGAPAEEPDVALTPS